jgi:PTH1 family peptidyl-tRNA hydrolase
MKVIVGLGNPGRKYSGTRHNVGFQVVSELALRHNAAAHRLKFEAEITEIQPGSERVVLAAPQTFMNASGRSVRSLMDFYQLKLSNLLVICDDIALPLGRIRLRKSGSSGGQKGLENILQQLGMQEVARLRIGVDAPPPQMDAADYVLGKFSKAEKEIVDNVLSRAADAAEAWAINGITAAMNRFNSAGPETLPEPG